MAAVSSEEAKLKKSLDLFSLIAMGVGINIGAALFVTPGPMAGMTGSALWVARIVSYIPLVFIIPHYMMLTSAYPTSAGSYRYMKLVSPHIAMGLYWQFVVGALFTMALMSLGVGNYLNKMVPAIPPETGAFLSILLFYFINLLGIDIVKWVQNVLVVILLVVLAWFIVFGLPAVRVENLAPVYPGGWIGVFTVAAITFQLAGGGLGFIEAGGEVKGGGRTFLWAVPVSMGIVMVVSILVEIIAFGTIGWQALAKDGTLVAPARTFLPGGDSAIALFAIGGAFVAAVTTIHAIYLMISRQVMVLAQDGGGPRFLAQVSDRFRTPHWALTLVLVISVGVLFLRLGVAFLSAVLNFGFLLAITVVVISACMLPTRYPDLYARALYRPRQRTLIVCAALGLPWLVISEAMILMQMGWMTLGFVGVVVLAFLYSLYVNKVRTPVIADESLVPRPA